MKHIWYDYILRLLTIIVILVGLKMMIVGAPTAIGLIGFLLMALGWGLQFMFYPHKNDTWNLDNYNNSASR